MTSQFPPQPNYWAAILLSLQYVIKDVYNHKAGLLMAFIAKIISEQWLKSVSKAICRAH